MGGNFHEFLNDTNSSALETNGNLNLLYVIVQGYLLTFIALLGIFGNCLSILVLGGKQMRRSSINILLLGLQISDLIAVTGLMVQYGLPRVMKHLGIRFLGTFWWTLTDYVTYSLYFSAEVSSHIFTVLVTLERYIAVCHPLKVPLWCTPTRAKIAGVSTFVFATLFGVPMWFTYLVEKKLNIIPVQEDNLRLYLEDRDARISNAIFNTLSKGTLYYTIFIGYEALIFIIMYFIPFVVLITFNIKIFRKYKKSSTQRKSLTNQSSISPSKAGENEGTGALSRMLFSIVITFILCNSFQLIANVHQAAGVWRNSWWVHWLLYPYKKVFLTLNYAVNFLFYIAFGQKFRQELKKFLRIYEFRRGGKLSEFSLVSTSSSGKTITSKSLQRTRTQK